MGFGASCGKGVDGFIWFLERSCKFFFLLKKLKVGKFLFVRILQNLEILETLSLKVFLGHHNVLCVPREGYYKFAVQELIEVVRSEGWVDGVSN